MQLLIVSPELLPGGIENKARRGWYTQRACVGVECSGINSKGEAWPHLGLNKLITNVLRMSVCLVCSWEESCTWGLLLQPHLQMNSHILVSIFISKNNSTTVMVLRVTRLLCIYNSLLYDTALLCQDKTAKPCIHVGASIN